VKTRFIIYGIVVVIVSSLLSWSAMLDEAGDGTGSSGRSSYSSGSGSGGGSFGGHK
jgi:hypothetical protein